MDKLAQLFGQGNNQQQYQDFAQRYQQDPSSISDAEAAQRYHELVSHASPQQLDQAHQQALSQLSDQQRMQMAQQFQQAHQDPNVPWQGYPQNMNPNQVAQPQQLGQMASQAAQQDPNLVGKIFGSTGGKLAMAGAAAFLASQFLGGPDKD